jgi:alpha-ketoglutarate-dependent sulfate ester dioxygenase
MEWGMSTAEQILDVRKVAGAIGAEVTGVRLSGDLDDSVVAAVRAAVLEHRVVFLRGQDHLDDETQAAFARRLGELTTAHPTVPSVEHDRTVLAVDSAGGNRANSWHTDVTFVDHPPAFSLLRAIVLPPYGGDTSWANTVTAYESLPAPLRELAERLWAEHTNDYDYATSHAVVELTEEQAARQEEFTATVYKTEHPVVQVHPETGEKALLLGQFAQRFVGLTGTDSRHLLALFQEHVTRLENTVRWQWQPGDIAIWDNRGTQHYAVADYGDLPRRLHRVTVVGTVPVGVDGRRSIARQGDASGYLAAG